MEIVKTEFHCWIMTKLLAQFFFREVLKEASDGFLAAINYKKQGHLKLP